MNNDEPYNLGPGNVVFEGPTLTEDGDGDGDGEVEDPLKDYREWMATKRAQLELSERYERGLKAAVDLSPMSQLLAHLYAWSHISLQTVRLRSAELAPKT